MNGISSYYRAESIISLHTATRLIRAKTVLQEGLTRAKTVSSSSVA
ncbi:hypothetical protein DOT_3172 [Desulfosporosinus sp. OT]|nr:hypothetical protein DOT_3172 [Desulfosporosinus sp. OT]